MAYTVRIYYPEAPSGTYELYEPNSTSRVTAYSNYAATSTLTTAQQVLNSSGRAKFWVKQVVEVVVKTAAGVEVDRFIEGGRAELVEVANNFLTGTLSNGSQGAGGTTTLNAALTSALSSFMGTDFKYLEATGGNARLLRDVLAERFVSVFDVKGANGEVAKGDGTADDYVALQKLLDRLAAKGGGVGLLPKGTFACSAGLSTSTAGIWLMGLGATASKIKGTGAAITLLTVNITGEANMVISDLALTHSTTSTGSAISVTSGDGVVCQRVVTSLHRKGFTWTSTVQRGELHHCRVDSTDGNSAGVGFTLGKHGLADHCIAAAATGTGFVLGGQHAHARDCMVVASTGTGFSFTADDTIARDSIAGACTTGFSVGAVARSGCINCRVGTNTTDFTTNASATDVIDEMNSFSTRTLAEYGGAWQSQPRCNVFKRNRSAQAGGTFTPDPSLGELQVCRTTAALTIGATSTTGLHDGQTMLLVLSNQSGAGVALTWNAQYFGYLPTSNFSGNVAIRFTWRASSSKWLSTQIGKEDGGATFSYPNNAGSNDIW